MIAEHNDISISPEDKECEEVYSELAAIRAEMIAEATRSQSRLDQVHPSHQASARNLFHYLALRRRDIRPLQLQLAALGLSSLGRAESHVLATVEAVLEVLRRLLKHPPELPTLEAAVIDFATGKRLLMEQTEALLGPATPGRGVRIMVTMPGEAADDDTIVHNLLKQGMECMRINCAHDDPERWSRMIVNLRRAEKSLGRSCRVVMDLAGPKLRTGPLAPSPAVIRIQPHRDVYGNVTAPAQVWLTSDATLLPPPSTADASLPMPDTWLALLRPGNKVKFLDARGRRRTFIVVEVTDEGCWVETTRTVYIVPGTILQHERGVAKKGERSAPVGDIPPTEDYVVVYQGEHVVVTRNLEPGRPATRDSSGQVIDAARIGCTIPEVMDDVRAGESILFDDGRIGGIIEKVEATQVLVRITRARLRGEKLGGDKGINLPDSNLRLAALTAKDYEDLPFVAHHADIVELSFVNSADDVEALQRHLTTFGNRPPAVVLKIETRRAFENLPGMLLTAMRSPCCGVMIARGDLAVECGFERMAEVQEEILWICEAAHVPVIWATQVLESLAKEGIPSRAEITDAAMGDRAECVMLNKGPHVLNAVGVLDDILRRMQDHHSKKRSMMRELQMAHPVPTTSGTPPDPESTFASGTP